MTKLPLGNHGLFSQRLESILHCLVVSTLVFCVVQLHYAVVLRHIECDTLDHFSLFHKAYLEVLVIDAEPLSQISENKRAILFKLKMAWHILSEKQRRKGVNKIKKHLESCLGESQKEKSQLHIFAFLFEINQIFV